MADSSRLTETQRTLLTCTLDCLIPPSPDRGLPGAGELGLATYVEEKLGEAVAMIAVGLDGLDQRSQASEGAPFSALSAERRTTVLKAASEGDPSLIPALLFHTYGGYYQQPAVLEALGMEGRPPHPKGYEMKESDPGLLDSVRGRRKVFREV